MKTEEQKISLPKDETEAKKLNDGAEKGSKASKSSKKAAIKNEKVESEEKEDEKPTEEQKISSFWTEIRTVPKSTSDRWVIPYDLEKNKYDYENAEIPKEINAVLDREEFDRMMNQINSHPKIVSSSTKPHRKLFGVALAAIGIFIAELYSDIIPQEALLAVVCLGFVLVILILNYIEEQKDSFGEVKRREINSILRQYECFTEKEVLIDFDVSDFGSYITVTRLLNTKKLAHVLEQDGQITLDPHSNQAPLKDSKDGSKKDSNDGMVRELVPPNKQTTAAGYSDSKNSDDNARQPESSDIPEPQLPQVPPMQNIDKEVGAIGHANGQTMGTLDPHSPVLPPGSLMDYELRPENPAEYQSHQVNDDIPAIDLGDVRISKQNN